VARPRNKKVDAAQFDVYLSRELKFNDPEKKEIRTYPAYTPARKVKYTSEIVRKLDRREDRRMFTDPQDPSVRAVAIHLGGRLRYVWRTDLLTEKEFDEVRREQNEAAVRVLAKKSRGSVGEGDGG
jgi:hypothetical protein